jgi:hypothetical protein
MMIANVIKSRLIDMLKDNLDNMNDDRYVAGI